MKLEDQDDIDDLLFEIRNRGLSLKGRFLDRVIRRANEGDAEPKHAEIVARLMPTHLLNLARRGKAGEDMLEGL